MDSPLSSCLSCYPVKKSVLLILPILSSRQKKSYSFGSGLTQYSILPARAAPM